MKIGLKLFFISAALFLSFSPFLKTETAQAQFQDGFITEYENYLKEAATAGTYDPAQASDNFIDTRLGEVIGYVMGFIGLAFFILIIVSGFQWMTAGGKEESVEQAKKRVINGTIGLIITLAAFIITNFVYKFFDEKFLKTPTPTVYGPGADFGCGDWENIAACLTADANGDGASDCIWENLGGGGAEGGSCLNTEDARCPDAVCSEGLPICLPDAEGGSCVECSVDSDCPGFFNTCVERQHECVF